MQFKIPHKRSLLSAAVSFSLLPLSGQLLAQNESGLEEIVVTGSLIRGTPEDAALPVETFSVDDLREVGNPTALEFVKNLTSSGPTTGEANYFGGSGGTSNVGYNLRGIGADKTLTLFNGRRTSENASIFPSSAVQRIEILKDGAAVTYGADATGGVVNFITRSDFQGFELQSSYRAIDGSDGDWNMSALAGFDVGDSTNIMFAAEWDHRSELDTIERSFSFTPHAVNPAPWSTLTNLAGWTPRASLPDVPGNTGDSEWGSRLGLVSDFDQSSCEAVNGVYRDSFTCKYNYIPYYNLVEENDFYRIFGQVSSELSENMDFFLRVNFARNHSPHQYGSPSQPVVRGPARGTGATYQLYVPMTNPFVDEFVQRTGWDQSSRFGLTQGFTPITYRPFAHGGNIAFAEGDSFSTPNQNRTKYWHISSGVNGEFDFMEKAIGYDFAVTFNQSHSFNTAPDILGGRLQDAINGFGGPNCSAADLDPVRFGIQNPGAAGQNGCQWFNPFASNFAGQPVLGLANPNAQTTAVNSNDPELVRWLFDERRSEGINQNITVDLLFSGDSGIELPGGTIAWGAGLQWRDTQFRDSITSPNYNGARPCMWQDQVPVTPDDPRYTGCLPDEAGPFLFFGTNLPDDNSQEQRSYFGELSFPVFDNLLLTAAARYEWFTGDLDATVYKFSGKWDITDNLALRGSYGDNYQAPGAGIQPGFISNGVNSYTVAGGDWRGAQTFTRSDIEPETATVWNTGLIWDSAGFADDHDVRIIVDYFNIETFDELGLLATANQVASSVFSVDNPADAATPFADCAHPLVGRVAFNAGGCVQGVTTSNDFASIRTEFGNGPGQLTAGWDVQFDYSFPAFAGDMRFAFTVTHLEKFEFSETTLDGFVLDPGEDRLGTLNFATIANAAPETRANVNLNYRVGDHNFRLAANFISGVIDERYFDDNGDVIEALLVPSGRQPGTTQSFEPSYYGVFGDDWTSTDFHYIYEMDWATLNFSIVNLFDEEPPASRQEFGYDPRIGNMLMRTFEIGLRAQF